MALHPEAAMSRTKPVPDANRAVAYIRVSTSKQDLGPKAQRDAIDAWAERENVTVVAWHEDVGVSGAAPIDRRPGLLAAIDALRTEGAGVLAIGRRDRLARDVLIAAMVERLVERQGAHIQSACGTANGTGPEAALMRAVVNAFSEYERQLIRARTRAALAAKKARGERLGGIPYGWRVGDGNVLVEEPEEQATIVRARELRAGGLSLRAVGRALLDEGLMPRSAKRWHVQVVARMIKNPTLRSALSSR